MKKNPYGAFRFQLQIEQSTSAGFHEVGGIRVEKETEVISEGGVNNGGRTLPRGTKYSDVTLKRGYIDDSLWTWHQQVVAGKFKRKTCTIILLDDTGSAVARWSLVDAFPTIWEGPTFNAQSSDVATETLTLAHEGLTRS